MSGHALDALAHPIAWRFPHRLTHSTWLSHVPFGMLLVELLRPGVIVELGTCHGVSYCAFCQAVRELALPTRCYAVDTWEGDAHGGAYGPEVLAGLREHHDPRYGDFSRLVVSTFEGAVGSFADGSIDLLHIDGCHTYEAARHDLETWLPKLSRSGVVLMHDINVRERGFGVWRLWLELEARHPSFAMAHGHGLGVLAVGDETPPGLRPLLDAGEDERGTLRDYCHRLGLCLEAAQELAEQRRYAAETAAQLWERNKELAALRQDVVRRAGGGEAGRTRRSLRGRLGAAARALAGR